MIQATDLFVSVSPLHLYLSSTISPTLSLSLSLIYVYLNLSSHSLPLYKSLWNDQPGNPNRRGRLSTVDLLIKVACFVKKVNNVFSIKSS